MLGIRNSVLWVRYSEWTRAGARLYNYLYLSLGLEAVQLVLRLQHGPLHILVLSFPVDKVLSANGISLINEDDKWYLLLGQGKVLFPVTICTSWGQLVRKVALV